MGEKQGREGGEDLSEVSMDLAKPLLRSGNVIRNFLFPNKNKKVALLFGWAAGDIKHVVKYTKCWEEHMGQAVVMTTPLGLRRRQSEEQIREKVNLMLQQVEDLESREVYIHSFSNGGMVFSSRAIDILQKSGVEIKSVVFDSAPSLEDSARVPALVFSESVPKEYQLAKTFVYYTTFFMLAMLRFVGDLLRINSHAKVQEYFGTRFVKNNLKHHPNVLFLYSSSDPITNSGLLEAFVKSNLDYPRLFDFGDSEHVAHYRKYPTLYKSKIKELI